MPKLCEFENCHNRACYARFYGKPERCGEHREDRNSQYRICKCGKARPSLNFAGETKAICCFQCKEKDMIDVTHKMCPNCIDWVDPIRGSNKYKGYCTRCYQQLFPTDPVTLQIRSKTKEIAVRDYINIHFEGFLHDKPLQTGHCDCSIRRRIDHRKLIGNTLLCIETDENQHISYDKKDEANRYDDIMMAHGIGKLVFIRFNPDKYTDKNGTRRNPEISTRLRALHQEIEKQIKIIENDENDDLLEIIPMYYNEI